MSTTIHSLCDYKITMRKTEQFMQELDKDPVPAGELALKITALPRDSNSFGDVYGGWLVSQMDMAGTSTASRLARGRVATVAIDRMGFMVPVPVGAQLAFYSDVLEVGRSSVKMAVEVWSEDLSHDGCRKVTEAIFVFVAIDDRGRTRVIPS
jgi:acyl-CoA thioesterase YciA